MIYDVYNKILKVKAMNQKADDAFVVMKENEIFKNHSEKIYELSRIAVIIKEYVVQKKKEEIKRRLTDIYNKISSTDLCIKELSKKEKLLKKKLETYQESIELKDSIMNKNFVNFYRYKELLLLLQEMTQSKEDLIKIKKNIFEPRTDVYYIGRFWDEKVSVDKINFLEKKEKEINEAKKMIHQKALKKEQKRGYMFNLKSKKFHTEIRIDVQDFSSTDSSGDFNSISSEEKFEEEDFEKVLEKKRDYQNKLKRYKKLIEKMKRYKKSLVSQIKKQNIINSK